MTHSRLRCGLAALLLTVAGCTEWRQWQEGMRQQQGPPVAAADPAPRPLASPVEAATPAAVPGAQQAETVAQVLDFVERLNVAAAEEQQAAVSESAPGDSARQTEPAAEPRGQAKITANVAADVTDPAAQDPDGLVVPGTSRELQLARMPPPVLEALIIRGDGVVLPSETDEEAASIANAPASTDAPQREVTLADRIAALRERVAVAPEDVAARWELLLLQLADGNQDAAGPAPEGTADRATSVLGELRDVIVAVRDSLENPVVAADRALEAANALRATFSEQADLQIPAVALCTRVQTFGVYDEMPAAALVPGRPNRTIVYVEIANFMSEQTPEGQYRTLLSGELEVLTADGAPVWRHEQPDIVDVSRQRRNDFFLAQVITLPATLGVGDYVLKVTMEDELSGKSNQAIHSFSLGTPGVATARP